MGVGLGLSPIPPFTAGLFATALQREFDWSRGAILASIMFVTVALVLLGPVVGRLVDRFGARSVAILSTAGLGLSLIGLAFINARIWTFYLCWAVLAALGVGSLPITCARVITGRFNRARGLALGIMLASTGVAGALLPLLIHAVMSRYGWRAAYVALSALPLLVGLPVLFAWLREPARAGPRTKAPRPRARALLSQPGDISSGRSTSRAWPSAPGPGA